MTFLWRERKQPRDCIPFQTWNARGGTGHPLRDRRAAGQTAPQAAARRFSDWERVLDVLLFLLTTAALTLVGYWVAAGFVFVVAGWLFIGRELRLIGAEARL